MSLEEYEARRSSSVKAFDYVEKPVVKECSKGPNQWASAEFNYANLLMRFLAEAEIEP